MKHWKSLMLTAAVLAAMSSVQSVHAQSTQTPPNSVQSSPNSGTPVQSNGFSRDKAITHKGVTLNATAACMAAVDELQESRALIDSLESENRALSKRLETEKKTTAILNELNETRKSESEALRVALTAKNETIEAKDQVIASQDKLITALKTKKRSPLGRIGDILIGAAIFAVLK